MITFPKQQDLTSARRAEGKLALFIAAHCSIRTIDHLSPLCKNSFKCDAADYLQIHRTKCTGILQNILGPYFQKELVKDVGSCSYSLILDESTDISVVKYLGIIIVYYSITKQEIIHSFLELAELETSDAEGITNTILEVLKKYNLDIKKLRGIGTDNASVMTGVNSGVYQRLKALIPHLILIRCICHSLQLAVSAASKEFVPRNLEFLIRETYSWFPHSALRQSEYKKLYNVMNEGHEPLKIVMACNTRWLSIESAVNRIHNQWHELKAHFDIARLKEKCYTAEVLYNMYSDRTNYIFLCFLKPVLHDVQLVNKAFESKTADSSKLVRDLIHLLKLLVKKITTPNTGYRIFTEHKIEDYVDRNCYLGYEFEYEFRKEQDMLNSKKIEIRERCIRFVINLINEISNRVPTNVEILQQIDVISVDNTLTANKRNINELLSFLHISKTDIAKIERQWDQINLIKWTNTTCTTKFWSEVLSYKNSDGDCLFKDFAEVAFMLLTLPHSNAEVVRLFSEMNIIKTKLRNRLKLALLTALLHIRAGLRREKTCCVDYDLPDSILKQIGTKETYVDTEKSQGDDRSNSELSELFMDDFV